MFAKVSRRQIQILGSWKATRGKKNKPKTTKITFLLMPCWCASGWLVTLGFVDIAARQTTPKGFTRMLIKQGHDGKEGTTKKINR